VDQPSARRATMRGVIDHVGFEVSDLGRSAGFYDALFHPLGGRRIFESPDAIGYGAPGTRHQYGPRYYSAYLLDPDGLRVEVVTGSH
jgi:catechol 2,3-dioxygenase-like lactoylglutathione lyase family enzyme